MAMSPQLPVVPVPRVLAASCIVFLLVWLPCISSAEVAPGCAHCTSVEALPQPGAALLQVAKKKGAPGVARDDPVAASKHLIAAKASAQLAAASKPESVEFEFDKGTSTVNTSRISRSEGIHRIVGDDGVLMITLDRQGRFNYTHAKLQEAGIWGTRFPAVDGQDPGVSPDILDAACNLTGCLTPSLQALVASQRNAWLHAQSRTPDWTLILEDDVIPVSASSWQAAFEAAWAQVPDAAKIVRLGRCAALDSKFGHLEYVSPIDAGEFVVTKGKGFVEQAAVACMQAYMVHKTAIPMLLSLIPCPYMLDVCVLKLFEEPGQDFLFNIDVRSLSSDIDYSTLKQVGVLVQDWEHLMNTSTTLEAQRSMADGAL